MFDIFLTIMLSKILFLGFMLSFLHCTNSEKRVIGGQNVNIHKPYMAYLLQAQSSIRNYDSWICGGAIVNRWLMLTSAACVEDVQNMYAVAGTNMYVRAGDLEKDSCTRYWKRKVVYTCVPLRYDLQYDKVERWSHDDVAVVKVEKPFVLQGQTWSECPFSPEVIAINFDPQFEQAGTDAIVLGWGHLSKWRETHVYDDYNQKKLHYVSVSVLDIEDCKKSYTSPDMAQQIQDYMICTFHDGKLGEDGSKISLKKFYSRAMRNRSDQNVLENRLRSFLGGTNSNGEDNHKHNINATQVNDGSTVENSRRKGFCQNDHGGPLVTWVNGTEHVIGIASVFRVDKDLNCMGPFLYTSTAKNKHFIECVVNDLVHTDDLGRRSGKSICDQPESGKALVILRRYIKWTEGTDRIPLNEVRIRPQISMDHYRGR